MANVGAVFGASEEKRGGRMIALAAWSTDFDIQVGIMDVIVFISNVDRREYLRGK
jgi:hypothetical protein